MEKDEFKKLQNLIKKNNLEKFEKEIIFEFGNSLDFLIKEKFKKYKNRNRIIKNDNGKVKRFAKSIFNKKEIKDLPSWVKKDIKKSIIIGRSGHVIQSSIGKKYHIKNTLNDLSGSEWTYFLNSVISTKYATHGNDSYAHHIRKIHPSPKPPQLMRDIIKFFTKENEWVLDYFMGVGGTLLGASLCNRRAIGIDLEKRYIETYKKANKYLNLKPQYTITGNSTTILKSPIKIKKLIKKNLLDLVLIDPPYGDMMSRKKTGEATKKNLDTSPTPFTKSKNDLGNLNWENFRKTFKESIANTLPLLKERGHIVVFIKDLQPEKNNPNLLHADIINDLSRIKGLSYLGTKIWVDLGVNLYPYGYPYKFVSNQIHQYILVFHKERKN